MNDPLDEVDLADICDMMKSLHIPTKGLNFEEMKAKLRDYLEESATRMDTEPYQVFSNAGKSDEKKRRTLLDLYRKTADFLDNLDFELKTPLQERFGDLKATFEESIRNLQPRDQYTVLIAGETSAGKSSVINLILGEDLLPAALLSTTSTICELKYGEKPMLCVHFKEGDGIQTRDPETHELNESNEESYKDQIGRFVNLKTDRDKTPYKKIELFWPHALLKEKVMIVDSPGVGESEAMNEFVVNYMPNAFCFIYVINSENAGGVQEDRLGMLLRYAQAKLTKNQLALFTGCSLFVCNKWDRISPNEQEAVKEAQIEKLSKKLINLDPKTQMVYLSCTTAQKCHSYGYITRDFNDLINGISNLLVSSMQNKLEIQYRWLDDVLFHVSRQVKIYLKSTKLSHQDLEKKMSKVERRMKELQESQQRRFDELSEYQSKIIENIIKKLIEYFKSGETVKTFCEWSLSEAPEVKATWKETKCEVLKCISTRTQQFVQSWEYETHEFAKAQVLLTKYCCEKYDIMEEEIHQVEEYVSLDKEDALDDVPYDAEVTSAPAKSRKFITRTAPMWLRQGLATVTVGSSLSVFGHGLKKKLQYKPKRERYKEDPSAYMSKRSLKCLKVIGTQDRLLPFINEQLVDAVQCLRQMKETIPKLLESDHQLYQKLLDDERSKTKKREIYEPLSMEAESLTRELTVFSLKELRKSDFTSDELKWDGDRQSVIGHGSFSTVYKGVLDQRGAPKIQVAIKEYKDPLTTINVWHFVDEERALRELEHPGIVKYFGTCLLHETVGTTVTIVLELCERSLKEEVLRHPENAPARLSSEPVRKKYLRWALQVLDTLRFIHSKAFVHRDLKLDNLLLTHDGKVKLADVGVGKYEREITGTVCGTSLYLAPEVVKGRIYNSRADMYSFGFVLWELWYGEVAFRYAVVSSQQSKLLEDVRGGLRPGHLENTSKPFPAWKKVMVSCWETNPAKRMKAGDAWECLNNADINPSASVPPTPPKRLVPPKPLPRSNPPKPPTKPKPAPRQTIKSTGGTYVSYSPKAQETSLYFESKE